MTLFTFGNSDGECRCDAKCYNAEHPNCDCICGGINHGKGEAESQANTIKYGKALLEGLKEKYPGQAGRICEIQLEFFK